MKLLAALLLACVAVVAASSLQDLDDSFLQEHGSRFLLEEASSEDEDFQYTDYVFLVSVMEFCTRHLERGDANDVLGCMGYSLSDRKTTPTMVHSLMKKSLKGGNDYFMEVDITDDARVTHEAGKGLRWTSTGTVNLNGTTIPYTRSGLAVLSHQKVTIEESTQVREELIKADAYLYMDFDIYQLDGTQMMSITNLHHRTVVAANASDGTSSQISNRGQVVVRIMGTVEKESDGDIKMYSNYTVSSTEIDRVRTTTFDDSVWTHVDTRSEGLDGDWYVNISFSSPSDVKISGHMTNFGGARFYYENGEPSLRRGANGLVDKSVVISGTRDKFRVTSHHTMTSMGFSGGTLQGKLQGVHMDSTNSTRCVDTQMDVLVGSDKSVDVKSNTKTSRQITISDVPPNGHTVNIIIDDDVSSHVTVKDNGDSTFTVHCDMSDKTHVHTDESMI